MKIELSRKLNSDTFVIMRKTMSQEDRKLIQSVPDIMLRGQYQMYLSNPYHSDIGVMKLYQNYHTKKVYRCIIDDLYCKSYEGVPSLSLKASITLIDTGCKIPKIDYGQIYEFSPRTRHLIYVEPEAQFIPGTNHLPDLPVSYTKKKRTLRQKQKNKAIQQQLYLGAAHYFMQHIKKPTNGSAYLSTRIFKVMILDWLDPYTMSIKPKDPDYSYPRFLEKFNSLKCVKDAGNPQNMRQGELYQPGEFIFFKNVYGDEEIGEWLRGVVICMSSYGEHLTLMAQPRTHEAQQKNFQSMKRLVMDGKLHPGDIEYRIRSVDYGCECRSSPFNMRRVPEKSLKEFKSLPAWMLRAKLFGIYPFEQDDGEWSEEGINGFNCWIRQKYLEDGTGFRALFRSFIDEGTHDKFDQVYEISLFHRYEPPPAARGSSEVALLQPEPSKFECLNWHMVVRGFASSHDHNDVNSNIMLEDHVVSQLVAHSRL